MKTFDLAPILSAAIALLSAILTGFVIPLLRERMKSERFERLSEIIAVAVKAAEQIYKAQPGAGELKKAHVIAYLSERGYITDIAQISTEIDNLIESAVYALQEKE